jgi:hypothetical protein
VDLQSERLFKFHHLGQSLWLSNGKYSFPYWTSQKVSHPGTTYQPILSFNNCLTGINFWTYQLELVSNVFNFFASSLAGYWILESFHTSMVLVLGVQGWVLAGMKQICTWVLRLI